MIYDMGALKQRVLSIYPYFGSLAANIEYQEIQGIYTIKSIGDKIFYDPQFMLDFTTEEQVFMLAREFCRMAFRTDERGEGKDPVIWQTAAEAVINQHLKRDGLEIVRGGIDYPEAIDYDTEEYYEFLMAERLDMDLIDGQMQGQENPTGGGESASDEETEMLLELLPEDDDSAEDMPEEDDEDDYTLIEDKKPESGNDIDIDVRDIVNIGTFKPVIDWRLLLLDTINYDVDWSYKNAILEDGMVRPILEGIPVPETEIVLDTSWSVDDQLLRNFLRQCKSILTFSKLKVGCFDTQFYGFHDIRTPKDIDNMTFDGGGGTDFNVAADAFTLRVDNRIIFTDGQAPMPDKFLKAIWIVYGDEDIHPEGGFVIHIDPEEFN